MPEKLHTITVGDLLDSLKNFKAEDKIFFGSGDLEFSRIRQLENKMVQIDFHQLYTITHETPHSS